MLFGQVHPASFSVISPWTSGSDFVEGLEKFADTAVALIYVRDRGSGRVSIDKEGKPRIHYWVDDFDGQSVMKVRLG